LPLQLYGRWGKADILNLTRHVDEQVYIETPWGRIRVMVCAVDRKYGRVTLGIQAPLSFNIVRAELVEGERKRA
jgi:sRNA-binding carbon storage regulator CsrA